MIARVTSVAAIISLLAANLIPLAGVIWFDWNVFGLMLTYWAESAIIGAFTIKKMMRAGGDRPQNAKAMTLQEAATTLKSSAVSSPTLGSAIFFIPFFTIHFGIFMLVHLVFILAFFFSMQVSWFGLLTSIAGLVVSHYISYQTNFIDRGEYKVQTAENLFLRPYPRIIIMHLTIIVGGSLALSTGQAVWALGLMVVLKTAVDLATHLVEHAQLAKKLR